MSLLLALLSIASLGVGVVACGSGSSLRPERGARTVVEHVIAVSRELGPIDEDDDAVLNFGRAASAEELRKVRVLVRRYFTAAAAGDGAKTCSMLDPGIAKTTVVEEDGQMPGLRGKTCAAVMSKLLKLYHRHLVVVLDSLNVVRVHTEGLQTYVVLRVPTFRVAREFSLHRVGGAWKIGQPLDEHMR